MKAINRWKHWDSLSDKNKKKNFFILYTIVFAITAFAVYSYFLFSKKTLIVSGDGWKQHFTAFVYFGQYVREIIRTLFIEHSLVIPQWNFNIGYGGDILTTLHYYVIGDPLDLLSVLCPKKYSVFLFSFLSVFRVYLAGLAFSAFCFYKKKETSRIAVISGSLVYVFFTYTFLMAGRHPFFANPMIYFPLLILGVEKILNKEKPYLFVVMVFISAISNFYFFYMLVLLTVIYVLFRLFFIFDKTQIKEAIASVFKIGLLSVTGVMMSAAIFLPVVMVFLTDSRTSGDYSFKLLYDFDYYKTFFSGIISSDNNPGYQTYMGFSSIALIAILLLFMKRKQNKQLKTAFIITTAMLLIPAFGYIFNGFSYIANRWIWAYSMLVAYILVTMWKDLINLSGKDIVKILCCLSVYLLICVIFKRDRLASVLAAMLTAFIFLCILSLKPVISKKISISAVVLVLIIATISSNAYFFYSPEKLNNVKNFVSAGAVEKKLNNTAGRIVKKTVKDKDFYRYSSDHLVYNTDLLDRTKSTSFYWSTQNSNIAHYIDEMKLSSKYLYMYKNLDERASLNALANVKYYKCQDIKNIPYGFIPFKNDIYINSNFLPLGYTYSEYITREQYDKLSPIEKQEALLQSVLLEKDHSDYNKSNLSFSRKQINYKTIFDKNIRKDGDKLYVNRNKAKMTLYFDGIEKSETYLYLNIKDFDSRSKRNKTPEFLQLEFNSVTQDNSYQTKLFYNTKYGLRYQGRTEFIVNTGYSMLPKKSITVTFPKKGIYTMDNLKVICQPMNNFSNQINALKENVMDNVETNTNELKGTIDLNKSKFLCISIPYSEGWKAYVDGSETELLKANTMFMALPLNAGHHDIRLVYHTPYLKAGICISAVGFAVFAATVLVLEHKDKRKKKS